MFWSIQKINILATKLCFALNINGNYLPIDYWYQITTFQSNIMFEQIINYVILYSLNCSLHVYLYIEGQIIQVNKISFGIDDQNRKHYGSYCSIAGLLKKLNTQKVLAFWFAYLFLWSNMIWKISEMHLSLHRQHKPAPAY